MLQFRKTTKNLKQNLDFNVPSKKGLVYVRQQAGIYRINMLCGFLLVTAVKHAVPIPVLCKQAA